MAADPFASLKTALPDLRITSQFRSPGKNDKVGGVANSYHLTGQAIDIGTPTRAQMDYVNTWAKNNGMEVIGGYGDKHIHVEPAGNAPRSMVDMFSSQYNDLLSNVNEMASSGALIAANPLLGGIYSALPDTDKGQGGMFSGFNNIIQAWPRITLIILGALIMSLGILALILNSGTAMAESVMSSDTGKNVAKIAKLAALA